MGQNIWQNIMKKTNVWLIFTSTCAVILCNWAGVEIWKVKSLNCTVWYLNVDMVFLTGHQRDTFLHRDKKGKKIVKSQNTSIFLIKKITKKRGQKEHTCNEIMIWEANSVALALHCTFYLLDITLWSNSITEFQLLTVIICSSYGVYLVELL